MTRHNVNFFWLVWALISGLVPGANASADALRNEPLRPLPLNLTIDQAKVELGRLLFSDIRLSGNASLSCISCHILSKGMEDGLAHSPGMNGIPTATNTPGLFNSGYNYRQQWSGGAANLAQV